MSKTQTQTPSKPRADELIQQFEAGLGQRRNFEGYWQILHDYFYVEAQDINRSYSVGNELNASVLWDATTLECADVFASGFMNYLTPPTSKWFRLRHKNKALAENRSVNAYFEDVADEVNSALNRSNFYDQMFPSYKSSGIYGTAPIFEEEDEIDDIRFHALPIKQTVIIEDARGRVVKFFFEFEYTAEQAEGRWGREALATGLREELKAGRGRDNKHKFLLYIAERYNRDPRKKDKMNMPVEAVWLDKENKITMDESGYNEFPAFCHRFDKRPFIPWGYSPAMKALPFARILSAVGKTTLRSMMKHTDPPIAVPHNSFLAPLDMNPRGVNTYKKNAMSGSQDMFAFGNYGNPEIGLKGVEYYSMQVKTLMYHDVFLAFSNITKDMNNPEIAERINEKMTMLGPAVGRYLDEAISPIVQRTLGILARRNKLPEPPQELMMDPRYEIDFVGILAQAQRRTELNSLVTGLTMMGSMAQYAPEVLDKIDPDQVTNEVWAITGAPVNVLRDDDEIRQIRENRAQAQAEQAKMIAMQQGAMIAKDAGSAASSLAKSKEKK